MSFGLYPLPATSGIFGKTILLCVNGIEQIAHLTKNRLRSLCPQARHLVASRCAWNSCLRFSACSFHRASRSSQAVNHIKGGWAAISSWTVSFCRPALQLCTEMLFGTILIRFYLEDSTFLCLACKYAWSPYHSSFLMVKRDEFRHRYSYPYIPKSDLARLIARDHLLAPLLSEMSGARKTTSTRCA